MFHEMFHEIIKNHKKKPLKPSGVRGNLMSLVPKRGLEPPRLAALVPETSASTNSATWASQEKREYSTQ